MGEERVLKVDRAQVRAAKLILKRAERGLGTASPAIRAIANAKPAQNRAERIS